MFILSILVSSPNYETLKIGLCRVIHALSMLCLVGYILFPCTVAFLVFKWAIIFLLY